MDQPHGTLPDWAYPAEDDMPESLPHLLMRTLLFELVRRYLAERGVPALTGSEQFVYWIEGNPHRSMAPDVYVLLDVEPTLPVRVVKTWELGAPALVIEIVSDDVHKDYGTGPMRYGEMGVGELIVVDPTSGPGRHRFQCFRSDGSGDLLRVVATSADRVWSEVLGCHLRWVDDTLDGTPRVRLATGPDGDTLVPTLAEAEQAERAAKEAEQARGRALEDRIAELEALLREKDDQGP
ncbi:MAG: Uma2 family endonuclease [Myxococcota bacterium]